MDRRVVALNVITPTKIFPTGAKAYLCQTNPGNGSDRIVILGRSRGGRLVHTWEDRRRLANFRIVTLPPEHPLHGDDRIMNVTGEEPDVAGLLATNRQPVVEVDAP